MKPTRISIALIVVSLLLAPAVFAQAPASESQSAASPAPAVSAAEVPRLIKFSGTLLDDHGEALKGPVGVTFALYSKQTGGAALWVETQNVKPDANGAYTLLLGAASANGVPAELFVSGEARWLGIQVGQQPEHERILLVSVPYALKAGDAETLGGLPASAFVTTGVPGNTGNSGGAAAPSSSSSSTAVPKSSAATTPKKAASTPQPATACTSLTSDGTATANSIGLFTAPCNLQGSVITQSSGNVGFGTTTPAVAVDVVGNNAGLRLSGTGTHQITVTGASSGRLGQDATGFFFSSDTNGKVIKFLTNNGALNEWMRITSVGNVGIGTTAPAAKLDVNGAFHVGTGNNSFRVDGPVPSTANPGLASWGGSGDFAIDAVGIAGGRFVVKDTTGNVGIGQANPTAKLDVVASATTGGTIGTRGAVASPGGFGVTGVNNALTGGVGVQGLSNATSGQSIGVSGFNTSTSGFGVDGFASATTGFTIGTRGFVSSPNGIGVEGVNNASTGGVALEGVSAATSGNSTGVLGQVASAGGTAALLNNTASGNIVIGQAAGVNKFRVDGSGTFVTLGNAYLATAGNGVILKSPNGSICVLIGIDNTGTPTFTTVTCPAGP